MGFVRLTYNMEQHTLKRYGKNTSSSSRDCNVLEKLLCFGNEIEWSVAKVSRTFSAASRFYNHPVCLFVESTSMTASRTYFASATEAIESPIQAYRDQLVSREDNHNQHRR